MLRWLWLLLGFLAAAVGFVGIVVPGLPATGFFILAAFFFSRSSPRFLAWVLALPKVGPLVQDYRQGLGMARRAKVLALCTLSFFALSSALWLIPALWLKGLVLAVGAVGFWFIHAKVPTKEKVLAQLSRQP